MTNKSYIQKLEAKMTPETRSITVYTLDGKKVFMIGQEWYDRFEEEVKSLFDETKGWTGYLDDNTPQDFLDLAKKAAGIES